VQTAALTSAENSDVPSPTPGTLMQVPVWLVAVATISSFATTAPTGTVMTTFERLLPSSHCEPRKVLPSPAPSDSKTSMRNDCVAATDAESTDSVTFRLLPKIVALAMTGVFCRLFAPASMSPPSLAVGSNVLSRLMPDAPFR
jgi:hypothetical protein